jgi:hypothetical protein
MAGPPESESALARRRGLCIMVETRIVLNSLPTIALPTP